MANFFKSTKGKILIVFLVIVLIATGVGGYLIFRKKLVFDYEKGMVANAKVEAAQYLPSIDKFIEKNSPSALREERINVNNGKLLSETLNEEPSICESNMALDEFTEMVNEYGRIYSHSGGGKYDGYDIHEIKDEISYITKNIPIFNQWFRFPVQNDDNNKGFVQRPYFESYKYYLDLDEDTSVLTITRIATHRSTFLDFDNQTFINGYYDSRTPLNIVQYEIMETNYYIDENNEEVVECFVYAVGVDGVGTKNANEWNQNKDKYYPLEYHYLKNVKDKSLIKYHITAAPRYSIEDIAHLGFEGNATSSSGMDIRGLNPYGVRREFDIVNYDGYVDIDVTQIDQKFETYDNPTADGLVNFDMTSDNIKNLIESIGLSQEEYNSATTDEQLLDKIAKQIVDNFQLKNNWFEIYRDSSKSYELDWRGPFYKKTMPITDLHFYIYNRSSNLIETYTAARVFDLNKFDLTKEYSLSIALKNRTTGKLYILATEYMLLRVHDDGTSYYRFDETYIEIDTSSIQIDEDGVYDVTCVLTVKEKGEDVVVFDTLAIPFLREYRGLTIPNSVDTNGVEHSYKVNGSGGKLIITVSSKSN